jgi:hypothetical protein
MIKLGKVSNFVALLGCLLVTASVHAQQPSEAPLSNTSVIKLVKAGFKEKTIIAIIHSRPNRFKLDAEQLIELKHGGVSENVILAMLSQGQSVAASDEEWDDEAFFRASTAPQSGSTGNNPIFGSGSGSKSETKTRGTRGGNQTEGNVTGSATVRILRPPAEAGAPAKLERTPSLTNEEVIRLVEAGFSEGTIIKRIENSPANFDLSPAKLEELQKRRVTDPIIAAMSAAMGESPPKTSNQPQQP